MATGSFIRSKRGKLLTLTVLAISIIAYLIYLISGLPSLEQLENPEQELSTKVYSIDGEILDYFYIKNRTSVTLSQLPPELVNALIATEDKNFYKHQGVNPVGGILRAAVATVTGKQLQGGSTITQQLVKSALLTPTRSVVRKIKEIILAFWVELLYTKNKILELYLNQVPYGGTAWGIEAAGKGR